MIGVNTRYFAEYCKKNISYEWVTRLSVKLYAIKLHVSACHPNTCRVLYMCICVYNDILPKHLLLYNYIPNYPPKHLSIIYPPKHYLLSIHPSTYLSPQALIYYLSPMHSL